MDLEKLNIELRLPAYTGLSDQAAANLLNTANVDIDRGVVPARDIFRRFVPAEYTAAITDATNGARNRHLLEVLLGMGEVDPNDPNTSSVLTTVFTAGSQTLKNLTGAADAVNVAWRGNDLRKQKISRAQQLGLGVVDHVHVRDARPPSMPFN